MDVWNQQKIKNGIYGLDLFLKISIKSQDQLTKYATLIFPQAQEPCTPKNQIFFLNRHKIKIMQQSEM
jgi:hypothetical protein